MFARSLLVTTINRSLQNLCYSSSPPFLTILVACLVKEQAPTGAQYYGTYTYNFKFIIEYLCTYVTWFYKKNLWFYRFY